MHAPSLGRVKIQSADTSQQEKAFSNDQVKVLNMHCIDCNQRILEVPKKRVNINYIRCRQCYKKSVTFFCHYPHCKQKLRGSLSKFCVVHEAKKKAEKKEILARAAEERRRKRLEIPDPCFNSWEHSSNKKFQAGVDMFEICSVLEITPDFTLQHLRAAYKRRARDLHPDKNVEDTTKLFQDLQAAYRQGLEALGATEPDS